MQKIDPKGAWRRVAGVAICSFAITAAAARSEAELLVRYSFICAKETLPSSIQAVVTPLMSTYRDRGVAYYGDRAVVAPVGHVATGLYLVPLSCGATGNCDWGVVASSPPRLLGVFNAAVIDLSVKSSRIYAFSRMGAGEGDLETLELRSDVYRRDSVAKLKPEAADRYSACIDNERCCPQASNLTAP